MTRFYSVRENGVEVQNGCVASLYGAAMIWSENPEEMVVFQTAPYQTAGIMRQVLPDELRQLVHRW